MLNPGSVTGDEEKYHDHDKKIFTLQLKQSLFNNDHNQETLCLK